MNTPSFTSSETPQAFYSLKEITDWQEVRNKAWTDEYDDTLYCTTEDSDIYALSNFCNDLENSSSSIQSEESDFSY